MYKGLKSKISNSSIGVMASKTEYGIRIDQFINKANPDIKNKYSFLLYYNTFFSMYEDNAFSDILVEKDGNNSWNYQLYCAVMMSYRIVDKNKYLGSFLLIVTAITQLVFYAQFGIPALIVPAAVLTIAHKVICIGCLPFVDPAKIVIYKDAEIKVNNEAIERGTLIGDNNDINHKQLYINLIMPLFATTYHISLHNDNPSPVQPSPAQSSPSPV
jgi:hypothetical protein